jgi:phosphatidylglycerophosphatase A
MGAVLLFVGLFFGLLAPVPWAFFGAASVGEPSSWTGQTGRLLGLWAAMAAGLAAIGVWSAGRAEAFFCRSGGGKDDGRIVIDEVAGQWIALAPLLWIRELWNPGMPALFFGVVTGFVLFRCFDIWKPGAIRWAERRFQGGYGVMADDLIAGLYAAVVLDLGWRAWILGSSGWISS